jgi:hypothetical protein
MAEKPSKKTKRESPQPPQVTRARGDAVGQTSAPQTKLERIGHIEEMMVTNRWRTGLTGPELAAEWRVSPKTVEGYSAEASRRIQLHFDPAERRKLKALWLANVHAAQRECREQGDMTALRGMLDLEARALGHYEADKVQVSGNLGDLLQLGLAAGGEEPAEEVD